ncbi:MAG TPA: alanine--glyoxylate aminotransferase family protein [Pseudobdellovibrionaceae bacterium]|nr:alanine--glyoxylate aminotransferase family protein [Pseudobdellovibrionaceae bacterium]
MLLTPGPVQLHPEVLKTLSLPMIHHRTPEFDQLLKTTLQQIKKIFQTTEDVFLSSSTGSGGMEALLVNTISPGDKVITIISGKFGERWSKMASVFGAQVIPLVVPWGQAVNPLDLERLLKDHPDTRAVLCQACETSTAVAHPIEALGKILVEKPNTLFLVDGITALGAYPLPMDAWHIDGLVGGSQKAFMLPTGMSLFSFSKKAWEFVEKVQTPRFYFDVRLEKKANQNGETFFSSNVLLIRALHVVLDLILNKGLSQHFAEIAQRALLIRKMAPELGYSIYGESPANSVTALTVPAHLDSQKMRSFLEEKKGITVMGGQDQLKGKILRIGHMGYIQNSDQLKLIESLGQTLLHFDPQALSSSKLKQILIQAESYLKKELP